MKNVYILSLLLISYTTSQMSFNFQSPINEVPTSQISHLLWEKKSLGTTNEIHFLNHQEIITSSQEGLLSKINITSSEVTYRKYVNEFPQCSSNAKYLLCSYQQGSFSELFNIKNGQLLQSVDMNKNSLTLTSEAFLMKKKGNLNVLKSNKKIKLFNDKGVLFESKGEDNVYDYYINEAAKTITVIESDYLKQLPLVKTSKAKFTTIANLTNTTSESFDVLNTVPILSRERVFHIKEDKVEIFNYELQRLHEVNVSDWDKVISFKHNDIMVIIKNKDKDVTVTIITKDGKATTEKIGTRKINFATAKTDTIKESTLLIATLNTLDNILTIIKYDLLSENPKGKPTVYHLNKETNHIDSTIKHLSSYQHMLGVIIGNTVLIIDTSQSDELKQIVYSYHQEYTSIQFSELIAYSNELSNSNEDLKYFTTFENIHNKEISSIIFNTIKLISQDIKSLFTIIKDTVKVFLEGKSHQKKKGNPNDNDKVNSNHNRVLQSLFIFTNENELIVLNGSTGAQKFKQVFRGMKLLKIIKQNYKTKILHKEDSIIDLVFSSDNERDISIFEYNLISNTISEKEAVVYKYELQLKLLQLKMIQKNIPHLITKEHANLPLEISVGLLKNNYHNKYTIDQESKLLYCFKYTYTEDKGLIISIVWNMRIEGLLNYQLPTVNENLIPTYLVDGKIFFKYISENIVLSFSKIDKKSLLISIIQVQTGKIIKQITITNTEYSSLKYLYEDNWGIISYVRIEKNLKRNEIFAIEILKGEIENSLLSLVNKFFKGNSIGNEVHTEVINEDNLNIMTKTFILSRHVKSITKSESEFNNANKFIVLLLENNQVFLIDRRSFSPRRPMTKNVKGTPTYDPSLNTPYVDPELPGYNPVVTLDHKFLLDPKSEESINSIVLAPSQHESTFILCTTGNSIGCYSVFPDKTFDALSLTFDYNMIGAFLFGCMSIVYFLRKYAKRKEFTDKFLTAIN